jgi:hypothetical protein
VAEYEDVVSEYSNAKLVIKSYIAGNLPLIIYVSYFFTQKNLTGPLHLALARLLLF